MCGFLLECLCVHMPGENAEKREGWSFINLFPFAPSEPAGIQHVSLTLPLSLSLSIHLPLIFSLMWWCEVIWGSCLRGRGRKWVRQSGEKHIERKKKEKRKKQGVVAGDGLWRFFPLLFDTNISFHSSFTFTYDKTLSEWKDMSRFRKIRHPTIPSRWKLEANSCPKIWSWFVLEAKCGGKPV